jgi:hypothetical protein
MSEYIKRETTRRKPVLVCDLEPDDNRRERDRRGVPPAEAQQTREQELYGGERRRNVR